MTLAIVKALRPSGASSSEEPTDLRKLAGTRAYYQARADDFSRRHPAKPVPEYYLGYGQKYFDRFAALKPRLSPAGQAWVDAAARRIALAIEDGIALETKDNNFTDYIFSIHPDAYLSAGLANLPLTDIAKIAWEPDLGDSLFSLSGVRQAAGVGVRIPFEKARHLLSHLF